MAPAEARSAMVPSAEPGLAGTASYTVIPPQPPSAPYFDPKYDVDALSGGGACSSTELDTDDSYEQSEVQKAAHYCRRRCGDNREIRRRTVGHVIMVVATITLGILALIIFGGFHMIDAIYMITQVITTVGYGDLCLDSQIAQLMMAFYVMWLLVLVAYFLNTLVQNLLVKHTEHIQERLTRSLKYAELTVTQQKTNGFSFRDVQDIASHTLHDLSPTTAKFVAEEHADLEKRFGNFNNLAFTFLVFSLHVAFGTVFFHYYERCSCSYGRTRIPDCTEDNACEVGEHKTWVSSFYMSMVTLTTVGFGDFTPLTKVGRLVAVPWMISGIICTAMCVDAMQACFFKMEEKTAFSAMEVGAAWLDDFDEGKYHFSKVDFVSFVLVEQNLVSKDAVEDICRIYDNMDVNNDACVTREEVLAFMRSMRQRKPYRR